MYIIIFWMLFGVFIYSMIISNITSIISSLDVAESRTQMYLVNLHEFSMRVGLPEETKQKVRKFIEANSRNSDDYNYQEDLLSQLPSSLRSEVISHTHGEIIRKIVFFRDKDISFLWVILPMLKPLRVLVDDIIFNQDEKSKEMYFILRGRVKLWYNLSGSNLQASILKGFNQYVESSYFGDSDLCLGVHDSTAIPTTEASLLVISKINVKKLIEKHPKEMKPFFDLANQRISKHQDLIIRSLEKDKEAFQIFKATQKQEIVEDESPVQHVVKRLKKYLETKEELTKFEDKILRLFNNNPHPLCESDSEEELKFHSEELSSASKSSETENSESSEDIENEEYKDEQISKSNRAPNDSKRRGSDVFGVLLKNRLANLLNKAKEEEKIEEKKEPEKVVPIIPLPPASTEIISEIIDLIKEENVALDSAVEEIFKHNRFIRDKAIENEKRIKQLLNYV